MKNTTFWKIKLFTGLVLSVLSCISYGQSNNNSWIDYTKTYYKIEVAETGIYKLDYNDLLSANLGISSLDPKKVQLFYRGTEQAIFVGGESDGSFDQSDYIYFYGEKNDGALDEGLYTVPNHHPHAYYSLITDTNAYFLCVGSTNGKRISRLNGASLNGSSDQNHVRAEVKLYNDRYYRGRLIGGRSNRSDYTAAEGWFGRNMSRGNSYTYTVDLPNRDTSNTLGAQVSIGLYGNSDNISSSGDNHHIRISASPNGSGWQQISDYKFKGYTNNTINTTVNSIDLDLAKVMFKVDVIDDLGVSSDNTTIGYFCVSYTSLFKYSNSKGLFELSGANSHNGSTRIKFDDYSKSNPLLFDLTNDKFISGALTGTNFEAMVPGAGAVKKMFLIDSTDVKDASISASSITSISSTTDYDYIIISADHLKPEAVQYGNYRSGANGGSFNVLVMSFSEVADQFFFGLKHPLAIRKLLAHLFTTQTANPENLLLIGKGYNTELARDPYFFNKNKLPTMGATGSDNLLSYNVNSQGFSPALNLGRVSANTGQEATNYLNKVKAYELRSPEPWQKEVFGVSGGNNAAEKGLFGAYIDSFNVNYQKIKLGARTHRYDKNYNVPITEDPKQVLIGRMNNGILLYHYFGHGTIFNTTVDIGTPQEYSNTGKYPFMFFAGCNIGDAFEETSIGEAFISAGSKGAIGWLAQSSLGYSLNLFAIGNIFSRRFATQNYGSSIGTIIKETLNEYENSSDLNIIHVQQQTYQGDPALKPYGNSSPDYTLNNSDVSIDGNGKCAFTKSLTVSLKVSNLGRSTTDSIEIGISRTLPTGNVINYGITKHPSVYASDIIDIELSSFEKKISGTDTYTITLDPGNLISESNEGNNTAVVLINNEVDKAVPSLPQEYGIVSGTSTTLRINNINRKPLGANYDVEIDTNWRFTSPYKKTFVVADQNGFGTKTINLLGQDSVVYYWRVKLTTQSQWCSSSFTRIAGVGSGWNQSHGGQLVSTENLHMDFDADFCRYNFAKNHLRITSRMNRFLSPSYNLGIRRDNILYTGGSSCGSLVRAARFDAKSLNPYTYTACNTRKSKPISVQNATGRAVLKNFIRSLPVGDHFSLTTILGGAQYLALDSIPEYLEMVGGTASVVRALTTSSAYTLVGQKGMTRGTASEGSSFSNSNRFEPVADAGCLAQGYWDRGSALSTIIGPASAWNTLSYNLSEYSTTDLALVSVFGVDSVGNETSLISNSSSNSIQLASLAAAYPYLRVKMKFEDMTNRSPAQLKRWTVTYTETAETAIVADSSYLFPSSSSVYTIGDTLKIRAKVWNYSNALSDSIEVKIHLNNLGQAEQLINEQTLAPLASGASLSISLDYVLDSAFNGRNSVLISALPKSAWKEKNKSDNYLVDQFQSHSGGTATPVEMLFFTGRLVSNRIAKLEWETSTELNNDHFEIERRLYDANEFEAIGSVSGTGNSQEVQRYNFDDDLTFEINGLYVYRLKQIDFDGTYEYSNEVFIRKNGDFIGGLNLYPNPTREEATLEFWIEAGTTAKVEVIDLLGRSIFNEELDASKSGRMYRSVISRTKNKIAPGSYLVKVRVGADVTVKTLEITP